MVKKNKREISNRLLYTLITIGILAVIGVGVYAYGGSNPSLMGHSAGELNLSGGVNGNAIFNGNVGIGVVAPTHKLEVNGDIAFIKNGTLLTPIYSNNLGEDIYATPQQYSCSSPSSCSGTNPGSDSCNSESGTFTPYNCTVSESRTCNDILGASGNINGQFSLSWRQVTCKRAVIFSE